MSDFTNALRELADWLDANPDVPQPKYPRLLAHVDVRGDDDESRRRVAAAAVAMGVSVEDADRNHPTAGRTFGPLRYEAVAVLNKSMAEHVALMSYSEAVKP